jgi:hypothetical protein
MQALALGMHASPHSLVPAVGHDRTQASPSQLTVPAVVGLQALQAVGPQFATSMLLTQRVPQRW